MSARLPATFLPFAISESSMKNKILVGNLALQIVIAGLLAINHPTALYVDAAVMINVGCIACVIWASRR